MTKTVDVLYFAHLRQERGVAQESVKTSSHTFRELYEELRSMHGLSFPFESLRLAVNQRFSDWNALIQPHDQVVFIPPVSGG